MNELEQLQLLGALVEHYLVQCPTNGGMYKDHAFDPNDVDKRLRDGIFFYSSGWGWRLRKDWQAVLSERMEATQAREVWADERESKFQHVGSD